MSTLLWDFVQLDITLVLVWVGIQIGLRPVKRLRDEIARRSPLDLRPIDEVSVPREIAPVVVTLNRLFPMLRTSVQSQQQFIANTAHQLRTPITGMQAQLELLAAEPAAAADQGIACRRCRRGSGNWRIRPISCSPWRAPIRR